jgi:hypothetical protein
MLVNRKARHPDGSIGKRNILREMWKEGGGFVGLLSAVA